MRHNLFTETAKPSIDWPNQYRSGFSHNQITIKAERETIWRCILDRSAWPVWSTIVSAVKCPERKIHVGVKFGWTKMDLPLHSKISELELGQTFAFESRLYLITGSYTRFSLSEGTGGFRVVLEEGTQGLYKCLFQDKFMDLCNQMWLEDLNQYITKKP